MELGPRYAIYFVPGPDQPLFRFGCAALCDCYGGEDVPHPHSGKLAPGEWATLTLEPRVYGFHATLKSPFRLVSSFDEAGASARIRRLRCRAAHRSCDRVLRRRPRFIHRHHATPPCRALDELAAQCVTEFDRFRAPLTGAERDRRMAVGLAPIEIANLDRWGYPYSSPSAFT